MEHPKPNPDPVFARHRRVEVRAHSSGLRLHTQLGTVHSGASFVSDDTYADEAAALADVERFAHAVNVMTAEDRAPWGEYCAYVVGYAELPQELPQHACPSCTATSRLLNREEIERRIRVANAPVAAPVVADATPPTELNAAHGFVAATGAVRLPAEICAHLGAPCGVVVLKRGDAPYVEILTNDEFATLVSSGLTSWRPPPASNAVPAPATSPTLGQLLRAARESRGLSVEQCVQRHIDQCYLGAMWDVREDAAAEATSEWNAIEATGRLLPAENPYRVFDVSKLVEVLSLARPEADALYAAAAASPPDIAALAHDPTQWSTLRGAAALRAAVRAYFGACEASFKHARGYDNSDAWYAENERHIGAMRKTRAELAALDKETSS